MKLLLLITLLLGSFSLMANPYQSQDESYQQVLKTGKEVSMQLLQTLGKNMKKNMKAGGPVQAFNFCATEAYPLTDGVNSQLDSGVSVKRISLKYRNPANAPQKEEVAILKALESLKANKAILPPFIVQRVSKDTYKYYKPLSIHKGICLKCHGDISNKKVAQLIKTNYPNDLATGYKMHDLRGAIVVTIKK